MSLFLINDFDEVHKKCALQKTSAMGLLKAPPIMLPVCTWPNAPTETLCRLDRVCLHGLTAKPEWNNRTGTVLETWRLRVKVLLDEPHCAPSTQALVMLEHVRKL